MGTWAHQALILIALFLAGSARPLWAAQADTPILEETAEFVATLVAQKSHADGVSTRVLEFGRAQVQKAADSGREAHLPGLLEQLLGLQPSIWEVGDRQVLWQQAMNLAKEREEVEVGHRLLALKYYGVSGLSGTAYELGRDLEELQGYSPWRPHLRYKEAFLLVFIDANAALDSLTLLQKDLSLDPDGNGELQFMHDMCHANAEMLLGRPIRARGSIFSHVEPWLEDGTPVPTEAVVTWIEYLMQSARHQNALDCIDRALADGAALALTDGHKLKFRARRATAAMELWTPGKPGAAALREQFEETLSLSGYLDRSSHVPGDVTWRLALLSLVELNWLSGERQLFLESLQRAEARLGEHGNLRDRIRLQRLLARRDAILEVALDQRCVRQQAIESLWRQRVEQWRAQPKTTVGIGFLHNSDVQDLLNGILEIAMDLEPGKAGIERALGHVIHYQTAGELVRGTRQSDPGVIGVKQRFSRGEDGGLLVLTSGRRRTHLFMVDANGVGHRELPGIGEFQTLSKEWDRRLRQGARLADGLREGDSTARLEREAAQALAAALFDGEVGRTIGGWPHLVVVGAEFVVTSSLAWLPLEGEPHLGLGRTVCEWPSIPAGMGLESLAREGEVHRPRVLLAGGALSAPHSIAGEECLPELPFPSELEQVVHSTDGVAGLTVLKGRDLTIPQLQKAMAEPHDIALLLTHAIQDSNHNEEQPTALVLSPGPGEERAGMMNASDLVEFWSRAETAPAPRLAILVACRSGATRSRLGSGIGTDLGSAFLMGRGHVTLTSDTDLRLKPARDYSAVLMEQLCGGANPAEAAMEARRKMVKEYGHLAPILFHGLHLRGAGQVDLSSWEESTGPALPLGKRGSILTGLGLVALIGVLIFRSKAPQGTS